MKLFIGLISLMLVFSVSAQNQHFFTQVNSSDNDAEEDKNGGEMDLTSTDLELSYDQGVLGIGNQDQWIGIRFTNITLPENIIIDSAYIQFTVDEEESDPAISQIYGEKTFNATAFADLDNNISSRIRTDSMLYWTIPAWNTEHDATDLQKTPNLKGIVEEIIQQPLWQSGNAMSFIFEGTGTRAAEAYDGESNLAPVLHIYYKIDYTQVSELEWWDAVKIFPNPASEQLTIDLSSLHNSQQISLNVFSADGKMLKEFKSGGGSKETLSIQELETGFYFLNIADGNLTKTLRFIKK